MPNFNGVWSLTTQAQYASDWPSPPIVGLIAGIQQSGGSSATANIDVVKIATAGNATDYGDLTQTASQGSAGSSAITGVINLGIGQADYITIEQVGMSTSGSATDFGDLSVARRYAGAVSNDTRCVFGGGQLGDDSRTNVMDYVTIASAGNATDFGDLTANEDAKAGGSSTTRGIYSGGGDDTKSNVMEYITIGSTGNATDFGDLTVARTRMGAASSATRTLISGGIDGSSGNTGVNVIDFVTTASTGNASDFGNLTATRSYTRCCSSKTRLLTAGGYGPSASNIIDFVTIASAGDASDFGDLSAAGITCAALSNGHGGIA